MPALWKLCQDGKLDEVRSELERGGDVNNKNSLGETALLWAVCNGHNSIVKLLLEQPAVKTNEKNNDGATALHYAAADNNPEVARMLLLHPGFNSANSTNNCCETALMIAVYNRHNSIVRLLLEQPAVKVNEKSIDGATALHCAVAVAGNNPEGARMLLSHPGFNSANSTDNLGDTALMWAVMNGKKEVLLELVKHESVSLDLSEGALDGR